MTFDLYTIDWTAIGSIITFFAMIIAYWTIHLSNKQNKSNQQFQILLIKREIEQKRLDELVESIIAINDSIQPTDILNYSVKLIHGYYTKEDQSFINLLAAKDESNNNKLSIQLMKYNKNLPAREVLITLSRMRHIYGECIRNISILNLYKTNSMVSPSELKKMIKNMVKISKEVSPELEKNIHDILKTKSNDLDKAVNLLNIFCYAISNDLLRNKKMFEKHLCAFVQKEQERIDKIIYKDS
ncbi:hypothetical protein [Bacteroides sp. OF04-15BH]|jgi:hypothetical protein|uniref:hypothetical protein n=1 Tax=Bacteroides sp. OF04-15BH TaxID=2292281 RepID=UPI000E480C0B|nr:hypothetical protein [Bacteroides sp. OF04-15BH]RHP66453.1 hypothetical protein DXA74_03150 [Bacteroides sp. OF04-15BH]